MVSVILVAYWKGHAEGAKRQSGNVGNIGEPINRKLSYSAEWGGGVRIAETSANPTGRRSYTITGPITLEVIRQLSAFIRYFTTEVIQLAILRF